MFFGWGGWGSGERTAHTHTGHAWGGLGVGGRWRCKIHRDYCTLPFLHPYKYWEQCRLDAGDTSVCDGGQEEDRGGVKKFGATLTRRGPVVPKGTLRAPVSPFQTTVWHYGDSEHEEFWGGGGRGGVTRTKTEVIRRRGRGGRRGGEEVSRLTTTRLPRATLIRMQTSMCHIYFNSILSFPSLLPVCLHFLKLFLCSLFSQKSTRQDKNIEIIRNSWNRHNLKYISCAADKSHVAIVSVMQPTSMSGTTFFFK